MTNILQINDHSVCIGNRNFQCGTGKNGFSAYKVEGDKKTPIGSYSFLKVYFRPDSINEYDIKTKLPKAQITKNCGWADDPKDLGNYNKYITKPYQFSHENLWREDHLYDVVVTTNHNINPAKLNKGSAIFMHVAKLNDDGKIMPTDGCLSLKMDDLLWVIDQLTPDSMWVIPEEIILN